MRSTALSRRDFLSVAAAAGVSVPLLGSCAGGATNDTDSSNSEGMDQVDIRPPSQYRNREHNVVIWSAFGDAAGAALDDLLATFNDSQDEIYAEAQFQGNYQESANVLLAALQANAIPDIAVLSDITFGTFLLNDVLEPLDGYFDDEFNNDIFIDSFREEGIAGGRLYWVSFARSTPLLYFNRDRFGEAGLPDRGPETWSELREWGQDIVKLDVQGQPLKVQSLQATPDWHYQGYVWQFGGRYSEGLDVVFDSGGAVEAGQWLQRFIFDDEMAYLAQEHVNDFTSGLSATAIASTGGLQNIRGNAEFNVGVSPLPVEKAPGVPTGGGGLSILKDAPKERKEAAAEVIKFLSTAENSAKWTRATGYVPIIQGAVDQPELASSLADDPAFGVAIDQLAVAEPPDDVRRFVPNAIQIASGGFQEIFSDANRDVQQVFSDVAEQLRSGAEEIAEAYDAYFQSAGS